MLELADLYFVSGDALYTDVNGDYCIPIGTITIQETKEPSGYIINNEKLTVHFTQQSDGTVRSDHGDWNTQNQAEDLTILSEETVATANVAIAKKDSATGSATPQGDASIAGIRFAVINRSENPVDYNGTSYAVGRVIAIIETDTNGNAATPENSLPFGTYEIAELRVDTGVTQGADYNSAAKGSSPLANNTGYLFNGQTRTVSITEANTTASPADPFTDDVLKGAVKIEKWDKEKNAKVPQGDADFSGIQFTVTNKSANAVVVNGTSIAVNGTVLTLTTNAAGEAQSDQVLPYGTYSIKETATNGSYRLTDGTEYTFQIRTSGQVVSSDTAGNTLVFKDEVKRGGVKVGKIDRETDSAVPQGLATLQGAEITIYNNSTNTVIVNGTEYAKDAAITVLTTGTDGTAETASDLLPYGSYYAKETKAPEGYLPNTAWREDFEITEDGGVVDTTDNSVPDDIKRADASWIKIDVDGSAMANIPFLVERLDAAGKAVEAHVIVTDSNGRLNTKNRPKTGDKVNSLDSYVADGWFTDESKLDATTGIWFGEQSARADGKGSLIYANYRITEIKCEANKNHDVLMQTMLNESEMQELNTAFRDGETYDLAGIFMDLEIHPESDLVEDSTGGKTAIFGDSVKFKDTVRYDHLKTYNHYKIVTEIWYEDRDGSAPVLLGSGEVEFDPPKVDSTQTSNGTIDNYVVISTDGLQGGTLHAVDKFYVKHEDSWTALVNHNIAMTDPRQHVYIPWMATTAKDGKTEDHVGTVEENATVIDTVIYENLADNKMYRLEGTLRYADTGEAVKDASGNDCVVSLTVRASALAAAVTEKDYGYLIPQTGTVDMPAFVFDSSDMGGKTLVVTEVLYDYDTDEPILNHYDLTDEDQSIHYPKITTEAKDSKTGTRTATAGTTEKIIDKVTIENTIPGLEYTVTGDLVFQKDGTDANGAEHKKGELIATHDPVTFTADGTTKVIELTYEVDSSLLQGITAVVFETLDHRNIEVAVHHDYEAKPQTPHWPDVSTTAVDADTKTRAGAVQEEATIIDTVELTNLNIGDFYKVSGVLMDKSTNAPFTVGGNEIRVESEEFQADAENMTKALTFKFDSRDLPGKSLVVFEKLFFVKAEDGSAPETGEPVDVARHEDINDENQTIDYPSGETNANDGQTKDEVGTVGEEETIVDTVTYHNLLIGTEYTVSGDLHYKEDFTDKDGNKHLAGDVVNGEDGKPITSSVTFTAEKKEGTVDLIYKVNSELLRGTSVVVYENFEVNQVLVYAHADLSDDDQRVDYPDVSTDAVDEDTEDHVGAANEDLTIVDSVSLTNLTVGKKYKVTGVLMDKETGKELLDKDGKEITAESDEFEATDAAMVITMTFTVNAEVAGKTVVVYEDLWHNDVIVAYHHDIEDEDQSVHYPEIGTVAVADDTEDHVTKAKETVRITDTVRYENLLTDGRTYVMRGVLMDKETQKAILLDGKEITAETKFVPEKETGEVEIVFEFDGTGFAGTTLVAFEKCYILKGVIEGSAANPENPEEELVAVHEDIDDEDQTVYLPEIKTTLLDQATEIDHSMADTTVTLIDTVFYKDLLPGKEYTVKGILMNKATGKEVLQDGKKIEESTTFKAEKSEGSVEVVFTFSSSVIKTDPVVAFEKLLYKEIEVAAHEDLTDADQTDYIPEISTTAKDSETEEHIALADEEVTIIDTVDYQGLKPDTRYVVKGVLMDKETGKELLDANGKQITSDVSFVTGKCKEGEASISGSIDLTFKFDGSVLAGKTAVAFERLYQSDKEVAVHTDIEDEEQTIHFPEGRTTATDKATENHTAHLDEKVTIEDEVFYKNLIPGKEYTVKGTLMIKETEKPLLDKDGKEITVTKTFKAEKPDGSILIVFENIDTTNLVGKSIVAFEQVDYEGEPVIVHADLEDEDQTVVVPEIKTTATDKTSGTKDMTRRGTVLLIDVVEYHGLTPGEEYTVKGEVYDKETGESIEVTAELTFVPDETDGSVELVFEIDTDAHHGHHLVVFEKVYDSKGNLIADHSDLEDEDQTVNVPEITGSVTGEYPRNPVPRDQLVITGDTFNAKTASALMLASGISSLLLIGIVLILKKRRRAAGMLLAILLLCGSMFAFGIKAYAATDETTVEETGVIRGEDGEFYYEFAPEIEKDGVKYELSDVSYEPDPLEKLKTDQTDEYLTSDNFSPPEQIEQDGIPYVLDHVEKTERVETARSVPYEESVERDDMVEIRQDELNVKVTDPITEEDVVGTVPFAESKVLSGQWMPDMQTDLIFSDYNGDYFDIAGVSYPKNKETPLPADSYPSVLTNVLKLPADRYRITSIVWNGEEYENDQGIFRNARIYGDSYHQMVKDTFRGDVALPDLSYTEYKCFYVESDEHLRARETATAIAVYKAVPEETTEETTTETPETELTKPAEPEVVNKTIFQQPVFYISIISVLVIAGVVIFLAGLSKKKKKENQNK